MLNNWGFSKLTRDISRGREAVHRGAEIRPHAVYRQETTLSWRAPPSASMTSVVDMTQTERAELL